MYTTTAESLQTKLQGKDIEGVFIEPGEESLILKTNQGMIKLTVDGDCCSQSWFSDIYNFDGLLGTVAKVEEAEMPGYNVDDGRGRQEADSVYGIKIITDKGVSTIAFRNSSNGYYGGSCDEGVEVDAVPPTFKEIKEDWKA